VPRRLTARDERAPDLLRVARLHTRDDVIELKPQGSKLTLPRSGASACVQYRVDLSAIGKRKWRSGNWRTRDAIVLDPALWLWYPDGVREEAGWRLDFELPPGYDVSAPWNCCRASLLPMLRPCAAGSPAAPAPWSPPMAACRCPMCSCWSSRSDAAASRCPGAKCNGAGVMRSTCILISDFQPDRWLSEGIASYYQNVLRARAGLKSAPWAWNALHAGFERGIRGTARGRSLAEVSETMMRDRSFMRVYWSGAAIVLADVELRRRSAGAQSLDTALAAFGDCCLPADRSWSARELMRQLDRLTGTTVFMDLYRKHVDADDFPDLDAVYGELGLRSMSATRLRLDPTAAEAAICEAIMTAPED
jgi:hypothetical protein